MESYGSGRVRRQQWLFYDILAARTFTGVYDGCLFSLRPPQMEFPDQQERQAVRSRMVCLRRWRCSARVESID